MLYRPTSQDSHVAPFEFTYLPRGQVSVGSGVGSGEGSGEGWRLGWGVGFRVGFAVGSDVGTWVGSGVGSGEGFGVLVGNGDGCALKAPPRRQKVVAVVALVPRTDWPEKPSVSSNAAP